MLNLTIVMLAWFFRLPRAEALRHAAAVLAFTLLSVMAVAPHPVLAQDPEPTQQPTPLPVEAAVQVPVPGQALQGVVSVRGTSGLPGFQSAELSFAYADDRTGTWFLIAQSAQPVIDGPLASWDTTTITDGDYRLRLRVILSGGQVIERLVEGLRVRNYSPVETATPAAPEGSSPDQAEPSAFTGAAATAANAAPDAPDFQPQSPAGQFPNPAPTNPAAVTRADLGGSALRGALIAAGGLLLGIAYLGLRALLRR